MSDRSIIWLASYPKSGNTWLRFIVFHLAHGRMPETSGELDQFVGSRLPAWIDGAPECCRPKRPGPRDAGRIARIYCKTHATAGALSPLDAKTLKAIHIHRHPLGVLQSALNYARLTGEIGSSDETSDWVARFIARGGNPLWFEPEFAAASWEENARQWLAVTAFPVLRLSYEATLKEPRAAAASVAAFLGLAADAAALDGCVAATSFQSLRAFEEKEIALAREKGAPQGRFTVSNRLPAVASGVRFFNRGGAGTYHDVLTPMEVDTAWRRFGPMAEAMGYSR